jgi:hypothetical protein
MITQAEFSRTVGSSTLVPRQHKAGARWLEVFEQKRVKMYFEI